MEPAQNTSRILNYTLNKEENRLIISDARGEEVTSIACQVIGSSFRDKIKAFFLTLFNWKWVKVNGLIQSNIILNVNSLFEALDITRKDFSSKNLINKINVCAEKKFKGKIDYKSKKVSREEQERIEQHEDAIATIKKHPVKNSDLIKQLTNVFKNDSTPGIIFAHKKGAEFITDKNIRAVEIHFNTKNAKFNVYSKLQEDDFDTEKEDADYYIFAQVYREDEKYYLRIRNVKGKNRSALSQEEAKSIQSQFYNLMK